MKEIIKLILKYHFTIVFVLLEICAFSLVVTHNNYQRTVFWGHFTSVSSVFSAIATNIQDYFHLKRTNQKLVEENNRLKNQVEQLRSVHQLFTSDSIWREMDSVRVDYVYKTAEIVSIGVNKTKNYLLIDKGTKDGVQVEMAVCSNEGVVGVVEKVSKHYARVIPLLNTNLRVSAKIKKNGYYGSLQWDGEDNQYSHLHDIPFHVDAEVGDTIVTSGFSAIFPEGELIGYVESVDKKTANFLTIKVKLATDFRKISDVYVIAHTKQEEQLQLENVNSHE